MAITISRGNRKDNDPTVRDIAASASPGGSTTGNAPDPGLGDPSETLPPPMYSWVRHPFPPCPRHPVLSSHFLCPLWLLVSLLR